MYQIKYKISELIKCIQKAKIKFIVTTGKEGAYHEVIPRFANDDFLYKTYIYGTMVSNQDYSTARGYLTTLPSSTTEEADFKTVQHINLDRLEDYTYTPSTTVLNTLSTIGVHEYPLSAYARSLYHYFTGEKIEMVLPYDDDDPRIDPRSAKLVDNVLMSISPNPNNRMFDIVLTTTLRADLWIYNSNGKEVKRLDIETGSNQNVSMDLSSSPEGIYFVLLRDKTSGKLLKSDKIIVIHK